MSMRGFSGSLLLSNYNIPWLGLAITVNLSYLRVKYRFLNWLLKFYSINSSTFRRMLFRYISGIIEHFLDPSSGDPASPSTFLKSGNLSKEKADLVFFSHISYM